jgi:hypothetical protein
MLGHRVPGCQDISPYFFMAIKQKIALFGWKLGIFLGKLEIGKIPIKILSIWPFGIF